MTGAQRHDRSTPHPDAHASEAQPSAAPREGVAAGAPTAPPLAPPASPAETRPLDPDAAFAAAVAGERRSGRLDALARQVAPVALVAGLLGVLAGPWLARSDPGLYLALGFDVLALAGGALGLWGGLRRTARLDYAIAGLIMGAAGLYFWLSYVTDPPQGST